MSGPTSTAKRGLARTRSWATRILASIGALALLATVAGAVVDLQEFDQTRGGYEPPYDGWTGTPIDWSAGAITSTGYLNPGRVVSTTMDCTTGMLAFVTFGVSIDYREVSARAIAVHQPRQACIDAGFDPTF